MKHVDRRKEPTHYEFSPCTSCKLRTTVSNLKQHRYDVVKYTEQNDGL